MPAVVVVAELAFYAARITAWFLEYVVWRPEVVDDGGVAGGG